jgi:hypothetical protein
MPPFANTEIIGILIFTFQASNNKSAFGGFICRVEEFEDLSF